MKKIVLATMLSGSFLMLAPEFSAHATPLSLSKAGMESTDTLIADVARRGGARAGGARMARGGNRSINRGGQINRNANRNVNRSANRNVNRNVNKNTNRNRNVNRNVNRNINRDVTVGQRNRWARPGRYWWPAGGAIAAGAAIGLVSAATAASWAGEPPASDSCWFYTDASRTQGFWDTCP